MNKEQQRRGNASQSHVKQCSESEKSKQFEPMTRVTFVFSNRKKGNEIQSVHLENFSQISCIKRSCWGNSFFANCTSYTSYISKSYRACCNLYTWISTLKLNSWNKLHPSEHALLPRARSANCRRRHGLFYRGEKMID